LKLEEHLMPASQKGNGLDRNDRERDIDLSSGQKVLYIARHVTALPAMQSITVQPRDPIAREAIHYIFNRMTLLPALQSITFSTT
jgi:hypothetical protein